MTVDYNSLGEITALVGCNLVSNLLPDGYAVESAHLKLTLTSSTFGSPTVAVWESNENNWSAEDATWSSYDGSNSWDTAGAKGSERSSLLDSVSIGSSYNEGDSLDWNVTLAIQNAMREDRRVDFIVGMLGVGSGARKIYMKNDYRVFFGEDNPQLKSFEALQAIYTKDDNILFVLEHPQGLQSALP